MTQSSIIAGCLGAGLLLSAASGPVSHQPWVRHSSFEDFSRGTLAGRGRQSLRRPGGNRRDDSSLGPEQRRVPGPVRGTGPQPGGERGRSHLLGGIARTPFPASRPARPAAAGQAAQRDSPARGRRDPASQQGRRAFPAGGPQSGQLPGPGLLQLHSQLRGRDRRHDLLGIAGGIPARPENPVAHPAGQRGGGGRFQPGRIRGPGHRQPRHRGLETLRNRPTPGVLHLLERPHRLQQPEADGGALDQRPGRGRRRPRRGRLPRAAVRQQQL